MMFSSFLLCSVVLTGPFGERLDRMIANHVEATDVDILTRVFREPDVDEFFWRTEFWGKYMHAAVPFWQYSGSAALKARIDRGVEAILAAQGPDGYIGNYVGAARGRDGWDIWGVKYTMLGLLHYYDGTGDARCLTAARRLCDWLIAQVGPGGANGTPLRHTGGYGGLPSCSVLEPVMWLYNRLCIRSDFGGREGAQKYLDFATYIVKELTEYPDGPNLIRQQDLPVGDRCYEKLPERDLWKPEAHLKKAYEFLSCNQGLIEYALVTGRKDLIAIAVKSGKSVAETEVNLAGGATAGEYWFHGAREQYRHVSWQQETCVITTWMRYCQKLLEVTDDPFWADQLEKTFYGAYLGSMDRDCTVFAAYSPLMGYRSRGHHHCKMHTNCCNANGPRGYLSVLQSVFVEKEDVKTLNFYMSAYAGDFSLYTLYPRGPEVDICYRNREEKSFTLRLRIPAFAEGAVVSVGGKPLDGDVKPGSYVELKRVWKPGDHVVLTLPLRVKMHRLHEHVAFTRGPLALARDTRFNDGALDDEIRVDRFEKDTLGGFKIVRSDDPGMFLSLAATLPCGYHTEDPDNGTYPSVIHFTDYASAGNLWRPDNRFRVWLPELVPGRE